MLYLYRSPLGGIARTAHAGACEANLSTAFAAGLEGALPAARHNPVAGLTDGPPLFDKRAQSKAEGLGDKVTGRGAPRCGRHLRRVAEALGGGLVLFEGAHATPETTALASQSSHSNPPL